MIFKLANQIPNFDFQNVVASIDVADFFADEDQLCFKHQKKFKIRVMEKCKQIGVRFPIEWDYELEYSLKYHERKKKNAEQCTNQTSS